MGQWSSFTVEFFQAQKRALIASSVRISNSRVRQAFPFAFSMRFSWINLGQKIFHVTYVSYKVNMKLKIPAKSAQMLIIFWKVSSASEGDIILSCIIVSGLIVNMIE